MKLSVIIPTHNRPELLRITLDALKRQTLSPDLFEVVVVDDGSTESNRAELRKLSQRYGFQLVEKAQGGLASARNAGAKHASGEILHFLDDDVVPDPATLKQHLSSHTENPGDVAVVGALPYPASVKLNTFLWYLEKSTHYDLYKNPKKYPGGKPPLPPLNGNASIRSDVFKRVGMYDETFQQYGGEDLELGYRLAKAGIRFIYNPEAVGYHHHVKDFEQFCTDMERSGESLIRIYRKYPEIREAKKIDVLEGPLGALPLDRKLMRIIMVVTLRLPWILAVPRALIRMGRRLYLLRAPLFPLYLWVSHAHYALGMHRGLLSGG